ncbi:PREDICTED: NADH-cytochrome b5 reductase-like [Branchiostoma belcheri]|uniref:cytochrome-b5 reductase n=1 Tax=Branchiostoma belcheri TaxID=7741 RepID=A0A6P4ZCH2_BRABE|nr:PREDICTED: NADH-cytochrome b5 reductase-like [Branchiostoma belcheri]
MENSDPPPTATQTASPSNCHVTAEAGCDWLAALERSHVTAEAGCDWPAATERSHVTAEAGCDWPAALERSHVTAEAGCDWQAAPERSHVTAEAGCDWPAALERSHVTAEAGCDWPAATERSHVTAEAGCDWPAAPDPPLPSDCCGGGCDPCVYDIYDQELRLWQEECRTRREGKSASQESNDRRTDGPALSPDNYTTFKLENIQQLTFDMTSETNVYRFQIPGNGHLGLTTGQHLIVRYRGRVSGRSVTRQYTPISPLEAKGYFEVLIKVYAAGEMSRYVRTWQVGDLVEWRGPFGTFTYRPNQYRQVVMVAAGTGVTPMLQVAGRILGNELDETRVRLLYACRRYRDILLKNSLDEMAAFWNFSASYWLSQENPKNFQPKYGDEIHHGRLDRAVLSAELPPPGSSVLVLICGTRSFNSDMEANLQALGFSQTDFFRF